MKKLAVRLLAPLTLFEWGSIFTYFYLSHRIVAFLSPGFRPLVLVSGVVLLLIALCLLFFPGIGYRHPHTGRTAGGLLAFSVLFLPIALAAKISPDHFDQALIENRGTRETADNIARTPLAEPALQPVYVGVDEPRTAPGPRNAFNYSASVDVPETPDYPSSASHPVPLNDRPGAVTAFGTFDDILNLSGSELNQDSFRPTNARLVPAEVIDLLLAARKPSLRQAYSGRTVEMVGQCLPAGKHSFKLVRLLMVCCAADAQPLAVRVESPKAPPDMAWAKVVGTVSFAMRDGREVPLVRAQRVTVVEQPSEPYIY